MFDNLIFSIFIYFILLNILLNIFLYINILIMEKININHYILDFAKKNILLFIIFIILLGVYPVQKIYLPKLYGKSISVISNKNKFIQSLKILLFVYIIIQFFMLLIILYKVI